ncbi:MAG: hypothetical protein ABSB69_17220 [Solirubrobacteraceae bacterium]
MNSIRRHLNYANVVATMALVFAMSGTALAAKHYLINSTKQIKPSVLKSLEGKTGKTGPQGPAGTPGAAGAQGLQGKEGPAGQSALSPLPSGASESGSYGASTAAGSGETLETAASFPIPLAAPVSQVVYTTATAPVAHCSGPGHAEKGFFCVYSVFSVGLETPPIITSTETLGAVGAGRFGFRMAWTISEPNPGAVGTYTVTAP